MSLRASKIFYLSNLPTTSVTMIINCLILETALSSTYHKCRHIIEQSLLHMVQYHLLCNLQKGSDTKARRHFQHRKINLKRGKPLQTRSITTIYIDEDPHNLCLFSQGICDPIQQKVFVRHRF